MEIQSIVFERKYWNQTKAKAWLKKHKYKTDVDKKPTQLRYRQKSPRKFKKFVSKKIKKGLILVLGK